MTINADFRNAVEKGDLQLVRIMLKDSLSLDPTFAEFDSLIEFADEHLPGLYDEHDGEEFDLNKENWNKDYMNKEMVSLVYNFSRERIAFLKEICALIYEDRIKVQTARKASGSGTWKAESEQHSTLSRKQIGTGAVIGGGLIAAVGLACAETIVTGAGIAVAVAGGIMILTDN